MFWKNNMLRNRILKWLLGIIIRTWSLIFNLFFKSLFFSKKCRRCPIFKSRLFCFHIKSRSRYITCCFNTFLKQPSIWCMIVKFFVSTNFQITSWSITYYCSNTRIIFNCFILRSIITRTWIIILLFIHVILPFFCNSQKTSRSFND